MVAFLMMILLHIIDDFVLQPVCLSKLKQKSFWDEYNKESNGLYKRDYKAALFIHALSWSIMIHIPIFMCFDVPSDFLYGISVFAWALMHTKIDNDKANKKVISLVVDQTFHFIQIVGLYIVYYLIDLKCC
jgi:hypothetical protein